MGVALRAVRCALWAVCCGITVLLRVGLIIHQPGNTNSYLLLLSDVIYIGQFVNGVVGESFCQLVDQSVGSVLQSMYSWTH